MLLKFAKSNTAYLSGKVHKTCAAASSQAKSRDDIMALMHVTYTGVDALPLQQDTEL